VGDDTECPALSDFLLKIHVEKFLQKYVFLSVWVHRQMGLNGVLCLDG
jgi:hypothetical protein